MKPSQTIASSPPFTGIRGIPCLLSLLLLPISAFCSPDAPRLAQSYGPVVSEAELKESLLSACMESNTSGRPILFQLGADWCVDCRRVEALKEDPELQKELKEWVQLKVNVGQHDRHEWLLEAFEVESIARWIALKPNPETQRVGCNATPQKWIILQDTVLEPISDATSLKSSEDLVAWLKQARP